MSVESKRWADAGKCLTTFVVLRRARLSVQHTFLLVHLVADVDLKAVPAVV